MKHYDVVGCGAVVRQYHAPILRSLLRRGKVRIHGCYDVNPKAAREVGSFLQASRTGTPAEIDGLSEADAVLIATPPESHAPLIEQYLSAGKAVFVEKPFVATLAEAESVVSLSLSTDTPVLVGHFRRFYPGLTTARAFLNDGGVGRIHRVEATEGGRWSWATSSPYVVDSPYGGVIYDTGSHLLDMVLYLLGADADDETSFEIVEALKMPDREPSHECRATIQLRKPGLGVVEISYGVSRLQSLAGAVKVHGDSGIVIVPTSFSGAPLLVCGKEAFTLEQPVCGKRPGDALGCFIMEHEEFLSLGRGARAESPLTAQRFVRLTSMLESLGRWSGSIP